MKSKIILLSTFSFLCFFTLHAQQKIQHFSSAKNINGNSSYINAVGLNNNPNAIIIVEYDAATAKANPHAVGVWYNGSQWAIFNQDRAAMPAGLTFNLTWKNADANTYVHKIINGDATLNHPLLNNNSFANLYASQVWNPGGVGGVYNNTNITLTYNQQTGKWEIKSLSSENLKEGSAYNILIVSNSSNANNITITTDASILVGAVTNPNLDFENAFFNWKTTGTAFTGKAVQGNVVFSDRVLRNMLYDGGGIGGDYWKGMMYNIGHKGNAWVSSFYENETGTGATGSITSATFKAEKKFLTFLLSGGADITKLYVELQVKKTDWEAAWSGPRRVLWGETEDGFVKVNRITPNAFGDDMFRYYFDLGAELNNNFLNKAIRIRIVDEKTGVAGYINADDFVFKDNLNEYLSLMRGGYSYLADKDKPVWGFADTHAHWVNHVGLKNFMWGSPGGKLETSDVTRDVPPCDGFNHGLPAATPGLLLAQTESKAFNRLPERLADPGNAACAALAIPCLPEAAGRAFLTASVGAAGQGASGANASTGFIEGGIFGAMYSMATCPQFQACGYLFAKDVFAKHYGNNVPSNNLSVSNYVDFPAWNSFAHQTMHISWVRRSYDGGQRLMVVPLGVAKSWEFNTTSDGVMLPALNHLRSAVSALKELARLNEGWIKIAYSAKEAREIILQNKMAIIIGLEQAEIGNYFPSVQQEVNELYSMGFRHFFPIHNINNSLGGAAVFNSALNSYNDLVNRNEQNGAHACFEVVEGNVNDDSRVSVKLKRRFMRQEMRFIPIIGFGNMPFFYMNDVPAQLTYDNFIAHKNKKGLTNKGLDYVKALMKKGVIIDIDHMSDAAQNMVVNELNRYSYPMLSGHTNFRDLRRDDNETDGDSKEARLKTEFTITNSRATAILNAGGMFGIMNQQNNIRNANGSPFANTSAGGSSSFAQAYWYALQKGGLNHGIAFGSDANGFAPQVSPRFGTEAAYFLEGDNILNTVQSGWGMDKLRRRFAFQQTKGVKYDKPISTHHYHRFQPTGFLTSEEREVWEGLAIAKSCKSIEEVNNAWQPGGGLSAERTGVQQDKVANFARGFWWGINREPTGDYGAYLECPGYISRIEELNNCMPERKAAYLCVRGVNSLPSHMKTNRTMELYNVLKPIYDLWLQFESGPNEPLRRSYAGNRDFDFNLDGQAHYGMLPDLIQDMKNQGLSPNQLKPLFLGAEQFIKMWEKAEAAAGLIRD